MDLEAEILVQVTLASSEAIVENGITMTGNM